MSHRMVRMIPPADLPYFTRGWKGRRRYHPLDVVRYIEKNTRRT